MALWCRLREGGVHIICFVEIVSTKWRRIKFTLLCHSRSRFWGVTTVSFIHFSDPCISLILGPRRGLLSSENRQFKLLWNRFNWLATTTENGYPKIYLGTAGQFAARVRVELTDDFSDFGPYLAPGEAERLDSIRRSLAAGDLRAASQSARVFKLIPFKWLTSHIPL